MIAFTNDLNSRSKLSKLKSQVIYEQFNRKRIAINHTSNRLYSTNAWTNNVSMGN